jgi:hydrogenase expression/formation protein HypE
MSGERTEQDVLDAIERRRRRPHVKLLDERITLSHGAGGRSSRALIETIFLRELANPQLEQLGDNALLEPAGEARLAFTTDSYVVTPIEFAGGNIGDLAINGTVNDLAMAGAAPRWIAAGFVLEEGLLVATLQRIVGSIGAAARAAGVTVVAGDTKVVERGKADGLYVTTTGIGLVHHALNLSPSAIRPGDRVLVSGTVGDHGVAIMVARGGLELELDLDSDTAPLHELVSTLMAATGEGLRCLRDPTRGGVATVLNEFALAAGASITIDEVAVPVRPGVTGACEILGIDPLYVANEGKFVAIVAPEAETAALAALQSHPLGVNAAVIGEVGSDPPGMVILDTAFGGSRVVDMLAGDPLPRIC